jgi:hypothetical protein
MIRIGFSIAGSSGFVHNLRQKWRSQLIISGGRSTIEAVHLPTLYHPAVEAWKRFADISGDSDRPGVSHPLKNRDISEIYIIECHRRWPVDRAESLRGDQEPPQSV